jgi:hypothetical protein
MEQEAADELQGMESEGFSLLCVFAVSVGEGDLSVVDAEDGVIAQSHPVGVAPQVIEDLPRRGEGLLGIDEAVLLAQGLKLCVPGLGQGSRRLKFSLILGLLKEVEELSSKDPT